MSPRYPPPTNASLLRKIQALDPQAWAEFVEIYSPLIYRYSLRSGLQPIDADDVTQEVFLLVYDKIQAFEYDPSKGRFRSWLGAVTCNKVRDFLRRAHRRAAKLERVGEEVKARGAERMEQVSGHLSPNARCCRGSEEATAAGPSGPAEEPEGQEDNLWIAEFYRHLFETALRMVAKERNLSEDEVVVVQTWWRVTGRTGRQEDWIPVAMEKLKWSYGQVTQTKSEVCKFLRDKMKDLAEDLPAFFVP